MARRGRRPYPALLTPREDEVLALLKEGLTNEAIAERLGISLGGAKYHVSEILGKLGVETREEAARWQPGSRPWWVGVGAPISFAWRRTSSGPVAAAGAIAVALLAAAGIGLLVWGLLRTSGQHSAQATPLAVVYVGGTIRSISDQRLVVQDGEGHLVNIRLEDTDSAFCDHRTPIPLCMSLSEAAPQVGSSVCVISRILPHDDLVAWLVMLDSRCQQVPASTGVPTP